MRDDAEEAAYQRWKRAYLAEHGPILRPQPIPAAPHRDDPCPLPAYLEGSVPAYEWGPDGKIPILLPEAPRWTCQCGASLKGTYDGFRFLRPLWHWPSLWGPDWRAETWEEREARLRCELAEQLAQHMLNDDIAWKARTYKSPVRLPSVPCMPVEEADLAAAKPWTSEGMMWSGRQVLLRLAQMLQERCITREQYEERRTVIERINQSYEEAVRRRSQIVQWPLFAEKSAIL